MAEHFQWRVLEEGPGPIPPKRRMKGKVIGWEMTEERAREHERATGRKLEKVPGSGYPREYFGGAHGWGGGVKGGK